MNKKNILLTITLFATTIATLGSPLEELVMQRSGQKLVGEIQRLKDALVTIIIANNKHGNPNTHCILTTWEPEHGRNPESYLSEMVRCKLNDIFLFQSPTNITQLLVFTAAPTNGEPTIVRKEYIFKGIPLRTFHATYQERDDLVFPFDDEEELRPLHPELTLSLSPSPEEQSFFQVKGEVVNFP